MLFHFHLSHLRKQSFRTMKFHLSNFCYVLWIMIKITNYCLSLFCNCNLNFYYTQESERVFFFFFLISKHACMLSCIQLFATPRTIAHQAPLHMKFSRQTYWSGLPFPILGIFLTQGSNSHFLHLLYWQADSLPLHHLWLFSSINFWFTIFMVSKMGLDSFLFVII